MHEILVLISMIDNRVGRNEPCGFVVFFWQLTYVDFLMYDLLDVHLIMEPEALKGPRDPPGEARQ